ncbi:MAG: hypothetical protein A2Z71_06475 [Chloroflexi bacterium RBG_13_50_21]|nr:MAG: hypothetical protein A2Z71_06475 [Chloroflexi bacterium RBG_13_50_21]
MEVGGPIPGGHVFTFDTDVSVPTTDINPDNNHSSFTLASGPDLFVEKTISSGSLIPGGSLTYYLHIGNRYTTSGWSIQGSGRITDTLPTGLTYSSSSWEPTLVDGQTIVWDAGSMGPGWDGGMLVYATITNTAQIGDVFTNTAVIASTNPVDVDINPVDNISSHTFTIMAPAYAISKQADGSLIAGTLVTYTLSVTNTGNVIGTNVQIYDPVPSDLSYYNSNGAWWDGFAVYWTLSQLAPNETMQVWFSGYLPLTAGITITNQNYLVTSSDQGISSPVGSPVSFTVLDWWPAAPSNLGASASSCTQIDLSWTNNSTDAAEFRIERSANGTSNWAEIAIVDPETTSYSDINLPTATTYYYQVRAYRSSDATFSNYSNIAYATTQTCEVMLVIAPPVIPVAVGQNFDLVLKVQAGAQLVDGAAAYVNFDPAYLQVVSITPGSSLTLTLQNNYDNNIGLVNFAAGVLPPNSPPSGTFTLATITFNAQALTPGTPIYFDNANPRLSDITYGGHSILDGTQGGTVKITPNATIDGGVILQGRSDPPHTSWSVPLTVKLTLPGQTTPIYNLTPTTDDSGHFTLSGIPTGNYDVWVKNSHTLQNMQTITLGEGTNGFNFGELKEGDADDNNFVTILDFSILATSFGKGQGEAEFDARADFNEDDWVTMLDFTLLATNFGQGGSILTSNPDNTISIPGTPDADVLIVVVPASFNVNQGDTFSVVIQAQSGIQLLNGFQAYLDFNPAKLRVLSLTGNTAAFPMGLQNYFNNTNGTINYARGTTENFPSGNVNLVTIQFEAIGEIETTPLTFHHGNPRDTDITYGLGSVLTGHQDGQLQVGYFNKSSPAEGATGVPVSPTLSWMTSLGATSYEYCIDTTDFNPCTEGWSSNGTDSSVELPELEPYTNYYWHVRAVNAFGNTYTDGSEAAFWTFTTGSPTAVNLIDFRAISMPQAIQLNWQTAQENDLIGFNLLRAEGLEGTQVKINPGPIPAANPGQLPGNDYQYVDNTIEARKTYYYWVEWVGSSSSEFYGPVTAMLAPYKVWLPLGMR